MKLKIIAFLLFFTFLNAFEVEFTKIYKEYVVPKKEAVLIETKADDLSFPFKFIKTHNGYILLGDIDEINMWLENNFYAPEDAKFKTVKIAIVDMDKIQYKVINKIKKIYKKCNIKKVIFLTPDEEKIIFKPQYIQTKYKIILNCK
jgi:hypothetical protein